MAVFRKVEEKFLILPHLAERKLELNASEFFVRLSLRNNIMYDENGNKLLIGFFYMESYFSGLPE